MAASADRQGSPVRQLKSLIGRLPAWIRDVDRTELGKELIEIRESIDQLEAAFAGGLRRFDKSGEYKADGAVSLVDWLRWRAKLSGGAAMERVTIARQLVTRAEAPGTRCRQGERPPAATARNSRASRQATCSVRSSSIPSRSHRTCGPYTSPWDQAPMRFQLVSSATISSGE